MLANWRPEKNLLDKRSNWVWFTISDEVEGSFPVVGGCVLNSMAMSKVYSDASVPLYRQYEYVCLYGQASKNTTALWAAQYRSYAEDAKWT